MKISLLIVLLLIAASPAWSQTYKDESFLKLDERVLYLPCPHGIKGCGGPKASSDLIIEAQVADRDADSRANYRYVVSGGKVVERDSGASWDLSGTSPGTYRISVTYRSKGVDKTQSAEITVLSANCNCDCECPQLAIAASRTSVRTGEVIDFDASDLRGVTYNWTIENGEYVSGQGTRSLRVKAGKIEDGSVRVSLSITGLDPDCLTCSTRAEFAVNIIK